MLVPSNNILARINKVLDGRAHIAGGALRSYVEGNKPRDIDIFMLSENEGKLDTIYANLRNELKGIPLVNHDGYYTRGLRIPKDINYDIDDALSGIPYVTYDVTLVYPQIVGGRCLFGTPENLVREVDFTCVAMALLKDDTILFNPEHGEEKILSDIYNKKLVVQKGIPLDDRLERRIHKYKGYGYER